MIYRNLTLPCSTLLFALILTGCGGGASEDTATSNKPTPVSAAASSISQVSVDSSSLSKSTTSLPTTSSLATFSSKVIASSASSTYIRASRASASASTEPEDFPDEIIIPEKPRDITDYPPTQPTGAKVLSVSATEIKISWNASTDDVGIVGYEIHRNGIYIGSTTPLKTSYQDSALASKTTYVYTVRAVDTVDHRSAFSPPLTAETLSSSSVSSANKSSSSLSSMSSIGSLSSRSASSRSDTSSQSSKSNSSQSSSKSSVNGAFVVDWPIPIRRENGDYLELHEIGGYELRHKLVGSEAYISLKINNTITSYTFDSALIISDSVEVAAFDTNGRYSRFINLLPK